MAPLVDIIPAAIVSINEGVKAWREYKSNNLQDKTNRDKAINSVMEAAISTKAYLYDSKTLGEASREKETELAQKWQRAAGAIRDFDENLFISSQVKALGWADPREWEKAKDRAITVNLDLIIEQCKWLLNN